MILAELLKICPDPDTTDHVLQALLMSLGAEGVQNSPSFVFETVNLLLFLPSPAHA